MLIFVRILLFLVVPEKYVRDEVNLRDCITSEVALELLC